MTETRFTPRERKFLDGMRRALDLISSRLSEGEDVADVAVESLEREVWTDIADDDEYLGFATTMETIANIVVVEMSAWSESDETPNPEVPITDAPTVEDVVDAHDKETS